MDSVEQICTSKDEKEICHFIQTKGRNTSFFLQIIILLCQGGAYRGIQDRNWRERESLTSVPSHESMGIGTHDPFLSTALLSATALDAVVPKQRGNKHF